jgi:nucleoside-diphosphate-sugar epimerase
VLVDNFATQRYSSLFNLPSNVPFRLVEADIHSEGLEEHFADVDVVIHLAALTDATNSFQMRDEVERVNLEGTKRIGEICAAAGCKMIYLSTTSVYGVSEGEVDEDCPETMLKPQSPYAESKLGGESLLQELGEKDGLEFVICRLGTIFGVSKGMRFHTAVNKFCWQAVTGQPITVWSTALDQKRPYLALSDAVDAFKFIIQRDLFDRSIYNVVSTNATVRDIVDCISERVPDLTVKYVDSEIMNQLSYTVSSRRFSQLGFSFRGSLDEGIADTVRLLQGVRQW